MAEAFKHAINAAAVRTAAAHLARVAPSLGAAFDAEAFCGTVVPQLDALELKARAMCVADALERYLPPDFPAAASLLERALAPLDVGPGAAREAQGLQGWFLWSVGEFVARRGLAAPQRALHCLQALTQRFTAEFAIRPFLVTHQSMVLQTLAEWAHHPSEHVRRLVSEGTRPRLPWGMQLRAFVADPSPVLPLLDALQDDPSEYVRRSVANHLNDIAKDHPALVVDWLRRHLPTASPERRALLRHASRTLVKQGHPDVLAAWGRGAALQGTAALRVAPASLPFGESLTLAVTLRSNVTHPQSLTVDYVVHHRKANGETSPKVFKGWETNLAPGASLTLTKRHAVRPITTRRYYPGRHRVVLQVNGAALAEAHFDLHMLAEP